MDSISDRNRRIDRRGRRRGATLLITVIALTFMLAMAAMAVDWSRVTLVQSEAQSAADAAARAAAAELGGSTSTVIAVAKSTAGANLANGSDIVIKTSDVEFLNYHSISGDYQVLSGSARANANAVRVTVRLDADEGKGVPLSFASIFGHGSQSVERSAIAMRVFPIDVDRNIPALANPWLAGMPNGTIANPGNPVNRPDKAPGQSPIKLDIQLQPGMVLAFDGIDGGANHLPSDLLFGPDGKTTDIVSNFVGDEHGMSDCRAPINAVMGVFLTNSRPSYSSAPWEDLDFSTASKRNFLELKPKLKQVFFIGDGRTSNGAVQRFVVPEGATRLFVGMMDAYEWNNNIEGHRVSVLEVGKVTLVR